MCIGILYIKGVAGCPGWFWLFVIMGSFTIFLGLVMSLRLPDAIHNPHSLFMPERSIFTPREIHILRSRVKLDNPAKMNVKRCISFGAFKRTFSNPIIWIHFFITMANNGRSAYIDT